MKIIKTELIGSIVISIVVIGAWWRRDIDAQFALTVLGGLWGAYSLARGAAKLGNDKTGGDR